MLKHLKSNKGQGTTEYIVILAIVVGIAILIFYGPLKQALQGKVTEISGNIQQAGK